MQETTTSHKGHKLELRKPTAFEALNGIKFLGDNAYCYDCEEFFRK